MASAPKTFGRKPAPLDRRRGNPPPSLDWWRKLWTLLAWCAAGWPLPAAPEAGSGRLTILHTNDLLGRLLPAPYFDEAERGGLARLAHLVKEERSSRPGSTLILDGGDALGDSPLSEVDAGRTMVRLMSEMGYDAMVTGNHEFDYGLDSLRTRAGEANFEVLGANVRALSDTTTPFSSFALVKRAGMQIALMGLLSRQSLTVINPVKSPLAIEDPHAALKGLLEGPAGQADLRVVLAHMGAREALDLVRAFPEVDLCIAGGFARESGKGSGEHAVRLARGGYLVTTPGGGAFLGRVDLLIRRESGSVVLADVQPRLLPVSPQLPRDPIAASLIDAHVAAVSRIQGRQIGSTDSPIPDTAEWVADLIRTRLDVEVSVINQGTLRNITLDGDIGLGTLARLVRYDDNLVRTELSGGRLAEMAASSSARDPGGQRLVFSGYDPQTDMIGGRPLVQEELYQVATTSYLASGGDGYLTGAGLRVVEPADWLTLRRMLEEHIRDHPRFGRWNGIRRGGLGVWKSNARIGGSLSHTALDAAADRYKGVPSLEGQDALAWNGRLEGRISHGSSRGTLTALLRTAFGQLRGPGGGLREAVDRLDGEGMYTLSRYRPAPFLGLDMKTVWTAPPGEAHPLVLRIKGGLEKRLGSYARVRVALGAQSDRVRGHGVVGFELAPEYKQELRPGHLLSSQSKFFWGLGETNTMSLQNFNSLRIRLKRNLAATFDANFFLHRDSHIQSLAVRSEIQLGLSHAWSGKWL